MTIRFPKNSPRMIMRQSASDDAHQDPSSSEDTEAFWDALNRKKKLFDLSKCVTTQDEPELGPLLNNDARWTLLLQSAQRGNKVDYDRLLHELAFELKVYLKRLRPSIQPDALKSIVLLSLKALHKKRHTFTASSHFLTWLFALAKSQLDPKKTILDHEHLIRHGLKIQQMENTL